MRTRSVWPGLAATLVALVAAPSASAYPGDLDTSFNSTGWAVTQFPSGWSEAADVAVQPDGKVVAVGTSPGAPPRQFAIARYNEDGSLDATFGAGGRVTTSLGATGDATASSVVIQGDGKIVVGGTAQATVPPAGPHTANAFALARYQPNGALDPTFGTGGTVVTYIAGGGDFCDGVPLDALALHGGQIYAAGGGPCNRRGSSPYVARYNANGSLDPTYGTNASDDVNGVANDPTFSNTVEDLIVTPDGGVIVVGPMAAGTDDDDSMIVRFAPGGTLDTAFGAGGGVRLSSSRLVSVIQVAGGRFVVLNAQGAPVLSRFDSATGALDTTFGSGGTATAPVVNEASFAGRDLVQDADGRLVTVSSANVQDPSLPGVQFKLHVALHRWSADGARDRHFGRKGRALAFLGADSVPAALAVDPASRLVAAGCWDCRAGEPHSFFAARFLGGTGANRAPTASFTWTPAEPHRGESIVFDATASDDPDGSLVSYRWDLDGSGNFASPGNGGGSEPYLSGGISFPEPGTYTVRLRVEDEDGATTTTSREVTVIPWPWDPPPGGGQTGGGDTQPPPGGGTSTGTGQPPPPPAVTPSVEIAGGAPFTNRLDVTLDIVPPPGATLVEVANDGDFVNAATFAVVPASYPWRLATTGLERIPRKVYVRFRGSAAVPPTAVFTDTIVLDRTAPRLLPPVIRSRARNGIATIRVSAADLTSGVAGLQVTTNRRRPGSVKPYRRKVRIRAAGGAAIFVRAIDRAGNVSAWRRAR